MSARGLVPLAEELLARGLAGSALRLLDANGGRGFQVNRLRAAARRQRRELAPGIHFACTCAGTGILLAARVRRGAHELADGRAREALTLAGALARRAVHDRAPDALPALSLDLAQLQVEGASLGLAAALAFCGEYAGRAPSRAVVALGELSPDGVVTRVDGLRAKLEAVVALAPSALVLLHPADLELAPIPPAPRPELVAVGELADALRAVFGPAPLVAHPALLSFDECLLEAKRIADHAEALRYLEAIPEHELADADRARLFGARGTRLRHLGRSDEALVLHRSASERARAARAVLGADLVEEIETEFCATLMDSFEFEALAAWLRARLMDESHTVHNEVRFRGMLAQVLSCLGQAAEGLRLREENLAEQGASAEMRKERPQTLCYLVYEAARARDRERFERYAPALFRESEPGDERQALYNESAFLRGLLLLHGEAFALSWLEGGTRLGVPPSPHARALLEESARIAEHPQVSTARAAIRALRRAGRGDAAARLAARVDPSAASGALVAWLAFLCRAEGRLADGARVGERDRLLAEVADELERLHPGAARFHHELLEALRGPVDPSALEAAIDRVYY